MWGWSESWGSRTRKLALLGIVFAALLGPVEPAMGQPRESPRDNWSATPTTSPTSVATTTPHVPPEPPQSAGGGPSAHDRIDAPGAKEERGPYRDLMELLWAVVLMIAGAATTVVVSAIGLVVFATKRLEGAVEKGVEMGLSGTRVAEAISAGLGASISHSMKGMANLLGRIDGDEAHQTLADLIKLIQGAAYRMRSLRVGFGLGSQGYVYERAYYTSDTKLLTKLYIVSQRARNYRSDLEKDHTNDEARDELLRALEELSSEHDSPIDVLLEQAVAYTHMRDFENAERVLVRAEKELTLTRAQRYEVEFRRSVLRKEQFEAGTPEHVARAKELMVHVRESLRFAEACLATTSVHDEHGRDPRVLCVLGYDETILSRDETETESAKGRLEKAKKYFEEALLVVERGRPIQWGLVYTLRNNLADAALQAGDYVQAWELSRDLDIHDSQSYFLLSTRAHAISCALRFTQVIQMAHRSTMARKADSLFKRSLQLRQHPEIKDQYLEFAKWCNEQGIRLESSPPAVVDTRK